MKIAKIEYLNVYKIFILGKNPLCDMIYLFSVALIDILDIYLNNIVISTLNRLIVRHSPAHQG